MSVPPEAAIGVAGVWPYACNAYCMPNAVYIYDCTIHIYHLTMVRVITSIYLVRHEGYAVVLSVREVVPVPVPYGTLCSSKYRGRGLYRNLLNS